MKNTLHTIELTSLSHDGRAVGRLADDPQGRVLFVENALPGQVVQGRITKSKKSFAEAQCVAVLKEAPQSQVAPCVHAKHCGGCPLQTLQPEAQNYWKERMVQEALARIAKLSPQEMLCVDTIVPSPQAWGYRNKMEFAFAHAPADQSVQGGREASKGALILGLRSKGSHQVVSVPQCLLMSQECLDIIQSLQELCHKAGFAAWQEPTQQATKGRKHECGRNAKKSLPQDEEQKGLLRHAVIRRAHTLQENGKPQIILNLITAPASKNARLRLTRVGQDLLQKHTHLSGFVLEERRSTSMIAQGEQKICTLGNDVLHEKLGFFRYDFGHSAFFQINTEAATQLCNIIENMADSVLSEQQSPCLWDVYCGVGAPGLTLASRCSSLYGVEINDKAIAMAKQNAQKAGMTHCQYFAGDAKDVIKSWPQPHMVLLDPPRMGLHADIIEQLLHVQAESIIYISCNPATLARDIALLRPVYGVKKVVPLDFFPQTAHVETCVLLQKNLNPESV